MSGKIILQVSGLQAGYDGVPVLFYVDLTVRAGELVTLLGANGAGKSTLLKTIMGTVPVISGEIRFKGQVINKLRPHDRVAGGIGFSPEGRRVFPSLSVEENLQVGGVAVAKTQVPKNMARVFALFPRLAERRTQLAGTLSGGEQQMLAIGRAMMSHPSLMLVEEPSQGLAPAVVDDVYSAIRRLADEGGAVLVAEQFQQVREEVSDRILVIEKGLILTGLESPADRALGSGGAENLL